MDHSSEKIVDTNAENHHHHTGDCRRGAVVELKISFASLEEAFVPVTGAFVEVVN